MSVFHKISSSPLLSLLLAILSIIYLFTLGFNVAGEIQIPEDSAPFQLNISQQLPIAIQLSLGILLLIFSLIIVHKINNEHHFTESSIFSLSFYFLLVLSAFPECLFNTYALLSGIFVLLSLQLQMRIYSKGRITLLIFNASVLCSFASFFFFPSVVILILIASSIAIFKPFNIKNFLVMLSGFALPYFYFFAIGFLLQEVSLHDFFYYFPFHIIPFSTQDFFTQLRLFFFALLILGFFLSSIRIRQQLIVRQRNQLVILFIISTLYSLLLLFFGIAPTLLIITAASGIFFLLFFHSLPKKWIAELILVLLFAVNSSWHFFS